MSGADDSVKMHCKSEKWIPVWSFFAVRFMGSKGPRLQRLRKREGESGEGEGKKGVGRKGGEKGEGERRTEEGRNIDLLSDESFVFWSL